jgi:hypothetical protein
MKAILGLLATFTLGTVFLAQPVTNEERPLPLVSAQASIRKYAEEHKPAEVKAATKVATKPQDKLQAKTSLSKSVSTTKGDNSGVKKKIAGLIKMVQPRKGSSYADHVADIIIKEAKRYNLDPYVVATTAYIESEFSMKSGPCMGIMQIERRTYRSDLSKGGLDPMDLEDNIRLGAWELALKAKNRSSSRIALASRGGLSRMWGRYNGAGSRSSYVRRAHLVYARIKNGNPETWKTHINKRGPLWKP